jgi:hypothetical protein
MIRAGQVSNALTSTMDIYPTIAALVGVPLRTDRAYDGVDLAPLLFATVRSVDHINAIAPHGGAAARTQFDGAVAGAGDAPGAAEAAAAAARPRPSSSPAAAAGHEWLVFSVAGEACGILSSVLRLVCVSGFVSGFHSYVIDGTYPRMFVVNLISGTATFRTTAKHAGRTATALLAVGTPLHLVEMMQSS